SVVVPFAAFLLVVVTGSAYGYARYVRPGRAFAHLADPYSPRPPLIGIPGKEALVGLMDRLGRYIPCSPQETETVRRDLVRAGRRSQNAPYVFYGTRAAGAVALFFAALWVRDLCP